MLSSESDHNMIANVQFESIDVSKAIKSIY